LTNSANHYATPPTKGTYFCGKGGGRERGRERKGKWEEEGEEKGRIREEEGRGRERRRERGGFTGPMLNCFPRTCQF